MASSLILVLHAELAEQRHHWTPARKGGLNQIQGDEGGKIIPIRMHCRAQNDGEQDKRSGDQSQVVIEFHD